MKDTIMGEDMTMVRVLSPEKVKRRFHVIKLMTRIQNTRKRHFNGYPPDAHAINIALLKIGSATRVDNKPSFRVARGSDVVIIPAHHSFGRNTLKEWVLEALLAEESLFKSEPL